MAQLHFFPESLFRLHPCDQYLVLGKRRTFTLDPVLYRPKIEYDFYLVQGDIYLFQSRIVCRSHGFFVDFFQVEDFLRIVEHVKQETLSPTSRRYDQKRPIAGFASFDECRQVFCIGQNLLFTHQIHDAYHLFFLDSQMVADIIDPRFRYLVIGLLATSARKELLDNPHSIFLPFPVETCGCPYFLNRLLSCFRPNAVGKDSRHILATFQIAGIFQGRDCGGYPSFDFRNAVIPPCFACNLQCRIRYRGTESGKFLNRLPNLLNLFEGEFGLIEQNKVFIQIVFIEQDITLRVDAFVTSGPACFLDVIFQ